MKHIVEKYPHLTKWNNEPSNIPGLSNSERELISRSLWSNLYRDYIFWRNTKSEENIKASYGETAQKELTESVIAWMIVEAKPVKEMLEMECIANRPDLAEIIGEIADSPEYEFD